jgi:hypothetical protein
MQLREHTHQVDSEVISSIASRFGKAGNPTLGSEALLVHYRFPIDMTVNEQPTEGARTTREGERGRDASTQGRLEH